MNSRLRSLSNLIRRSHWRSVKGWILLNFKLSRCLALWEVLWTLLLRTWAKRGDWENSYLFSHSLFGGRITKSGGCVDCPLSLVWWCSNGVSLYGLNCFEATEEAGVFSIKHPTFLCGENQGYLYGIVVLATKQFRWEEWWEHFSGLDLFSPGRIRHWLRLLGEESAGWRSSHWWGV